jgi:hypothetical protein
LAVTNINGVAMYGNVIAAQDKTSVFVFEKISSQWTQTASHTPNDINSIAIYSNFIVAGTKGTINISVKYIILYMD